MADPVDRACRTNRMAAGTRMMATVDEDAEVVGEVAADVVADVPTVGEDEAFTITRVTGRFLKEKTAVAGQCLV